ncbi:hypothetical protein EV175_004787, partial [Coemansia sp. RSA 1933]
MRERRAEAEGILVDNTREDVASLLFLAYPSRDASSSAKGTIEETMTTIIDGFKKLARRAIRPILSNEELVEYRDTFDVDRAVESIFRLSKLNDREYDRVSEA